jgi:hypothetical protein
MNATALMHDHLLRSLASASASAGAAPTYPKELVGPA